MTRFLLALAIVALCRAADLLSTWLLTPDLRFEKNPIMRWLGWRWLLPLNVAACTLAALERGVFFYALCIVSILASLWNLRILLKKTI